MVEKDFLLKLEGFFHIDLLSEKYARPELVSLVINFVKEQK